MSRRAAGRLAGLAALALAAGVAHAGALTVRDADGGVWTVSEDPTDGATGFLLSHQLGAGGSDARFGRNGQVSFALAPGSEPPASVRVDASRRVWMVGVGQVANQPQPVVARFLADGSPDTRWGVQGKVLVSPNGVAVRPTDLLPLADGSVVVAGETGQATPHAVVFHLNADGALDRAFGGGGLWQRADGPDTSTATSLVAGGDGVAAVAVAARGTKPLAELWTLTEGVPTPLQSRPLDTNSDGEDLRATWGPEGWGLVTGGVSSTGIVAPASLGGRAAAPAASAPASDPDAGGFSPFAGEAASAPEATADTGWPWTWIAAAALLLAIVAFAWQRSRRPGAATKASPRR